MAETEKVKSENNTNANDFRLWSTLYLVNVLRQRLKDGDISYFEIGSGIETFNTLSNNVVIQTKTHNGNMATHALQVKYSINKINLEYLIKNPKTSIYKLIESYLVIGKKDVHQLILWTNMDLAEDVKDYLEQYVPESSANDLLGAGRYTRYRLKKNGFQEIAQNYLFRAHPRTVLVSKIIGDMFSRKSLDSSHAYKLFHRILARDIIDCNGENSCFRQNFIEGDSLDAETKEFRTCFMTCMQKKFDEKGFGQFCMQNLNSDNRFQLSVDGKFGKGSKSDVIAWDDWKDVPLEKDVEDVLDRIVFYVNVAKLETLKTHLIPEVVKYDQFDQLCELVRKCTSQQMLEHHRIDRIFTLLKMQEFFKRNSYLKKHLKFNDQGLQGLKNKVNEFGGNGSYTVKASKDIDCTVSRLLTVLKKRFLLEKKQCLMIHSSDLDNGAVLAVLQDDKLIELGVKCMIISDVTSNDLSSKNDILKSVNVLKIFVGIDLSNCFVDDFDISLLDEISKSVIKGKTVCWSNTQEAKVEEIFSDYLFRKENHCLVLKLFRSETIRFDSNELQSDPYYISRFGMICIDRDKKHYKKFDLIEAADIIEGQIETSDTVPKTVILSDRPGSGKTIELINIALELRQKFKHYLIVYLDCKAVLQFYENDNVENMVCHVLAEDNQANALLIEETFHQGKVVLLMDGYDEVSEQMRTRLESLIRSIDKRDIFRLYIATRPHFEQKITGNCKNSIVCELEPFSIEDQFNYLEKFWKIGNISDHTHQSIVTENAWKLIGKFQSMLSGTLLGIPLQTHMIAVIYEKDIHSVEFEQPKSFDIGSLYKQFIELKFQEAIRRQMNPANATHKIIVRILKQKIEPQHCVMARCLLEYKSDNTIRAKELQPYGMVHLKPPAFVHNTYREYFLALYYLTHFTGGNERFKFFIQNEMSRSILIQEFFDYHIGKINPKNDLLTDEYLENTHDDFNISDYNPPSSARLHPNKMREFQFYLDKHYKYECLQHELIELCLGYSLINLFEVWYDTLPNATKSTIYFKFWATPIGNIPINNTMIFVGNTRDNPAAITVNHATSHLRVRPVLGLSEPYVVRMLKVLHAKNQEHFIRRFLLDMGRRPGHFLYWIFHRSNEEALEWFMTLLPQLDEVDRADFGNYVKTNFTRYFQVIAYNNASQFLQKLMEGVKEIYDRESVAQYLRDEVIFMRLLDLIEHENSNGIEADRRVEMVKSVCELFDWAFEGRYWDGVVIDRFSDDVNRLNHPAIRAAFRETFFRNKPDLIIFRKVMLALPGPSP